VKKQPRRCSGTAEGAEAGVIVPRPSNADLEALAEELRDLLRRGQASPATLARWERIATAIECGELRAGRGRGNPRPQKGKHRELAINTAGRLWRGQSWEKVCDALNWPDKRRLREIVKTYEDEIIAHYAALLDKRLGDEVK
jgi:hypothetical protein